MNFVHTNLETKLIHEIKNADEIKIAVAYFSPSDRLFQILNNSNITDLYISNNFVINGINKLEKLSHLNIQVIENKFLHAKVYLIKRSDSSYYCLIGSANLTNNGLNSNLEACIEFDTAIQEYDILLSKIEKWFDKLKKSSKPIDFNNPNYIYINPSSNNINLSSFKISASDKYYIIRAKPDNRDQPVWHKYKTTNTITLGWSNVKLDARKTDQYFFKDQLSRFYGSNSTAFNYINKFANHMDTGDKIIIMDGYNKNSNKVKIYGFGEITGDYKFDIKCEFGHHTRAFRLIEEIDNDVEYDVIFDALQLQTTYLSIHQIDKVRFLNLLTALGSTNCLF